MPTRRTRFPLMSTTLIPDTSSPVRTTRLPPPRQVEPRDRSFDLELLSNTGPAGGIGGLNGQRRERQQRVTLLHGAKETRQPGEVALQLDVHRDARQGAIGRGVWQRIEPH